MHDDLRARLAEGPLLTDGAMGTLLYSRGIGYERCFEALNETEPALVRAVHDDYIAAGAELIETNTFGANAFRLAEHELAGRVRELNRAGAELARQAADAAPRRVWVAGSIGPLGTALAPAGPVEPERAEAAFRDQAQALIEAGVDALVIETMANPAEALLALRVARALTDRPIFALATFGEDGLTATGAGPEEVARDLEAAGAAVVGANCSTGPAQMLDVVGRMLAVARVPVAAIPNAGLPAVAGGRYHYTASPAYMAELMAQMVAAGARVLGGCCGTTPEHIRAMRAALDGREAWDGHAATGAPSAAAPPNPRLSFPAPEVPTPSSPAPPPPTAFQAALGRRFTVGVALDPPRGFEAEGSLGRLAPIGGLVDFVDVADSPQARAHMSALALSVLIQTRIGREAVLNLGCRYRNLVAIHSELFGAHALGVRNVLGIMGALPAHGDYPSATVVNDITDLRLLGLLADFNRGLGAGGHPLARPTGFHIGCQLSLGALDLDRELQLFEAKVAAGAQFAFTDPIYDPRAVEAALAKLGGRFPIPVLLGCLPLWNARHAAFLHNEVPGVEIPESLLARMRAAGEEGPHEGARIAAETVAALGDAVAGLRIEPPFGRFEIVPEILALAGIAAAEPIAAGLSRVPAGPAA